MVLNFSAVHNIRFWYACLSNFPVSENIYEDLMQMDAYTMSIIISYGRLFGEGDGATKLDKNIVPENLREVHQDILDLRHSRYAHHGKHDTIQISLDLQPIDSSILVTPRMIFGTYLGAPPQWAPLFEWLDGYMYHALHKRLEMLTLKTGLEWKIESGPEPRWG